MAPAVRGRAAAQDRSDRPALKLNQPDAADPLDVLAKVGGLDIAGLTGLFLGGARYQMPVLIDGFISSVAAYCAWKLCPAARDAMIATHCSGEPAGKWMLEALGLEPFLYADMRMEREPARRWLIRCAGRICRIYPAAHLCGRQRKSV